MSLRGIVKKEGWLMTFEEPAQVIVNGEATDGWPVRGEQEMMAEWLSGTDDTGLVGQSVYRFIGPWRSDLAITSDWRLGKKGTARKFKLDGPPGDPNGREKIMVIIAKESV